MPIQGREYEIPVAVPSPVSFGDVDVLLKKQGSAVSTKTVLASEWTEVPEFSTYILRLSASDTDTVGTLMVSITTPTGGLTKELEVLPAPVTPVGIPGTCVVSGNIIDIGGSPSSQQPIMFRIAKNPATLGGAFVAGARLITMPDAYGSFSVALLRNAKVIVEIEGAGIRQQIVVPDASTANLIDLLPPITN